MNKYLTVKDVMEKLKEFPEDMDIVINNASWGNSLPISEIEVQFIFSGNKKPVYTRIALTTEEEQEEE